MADIISDGKVRVSWVPTITDVSAPTVAQLNAGQALEGFLTPDGLSLDLGTDPVNTSALNSTFDTALPGRRTAGGTLTMKQQGYSVAPWSSFAGRPDGYLVVRRNVDSGTAWTIGDKVEVYPAQAGTRNEVAPAANEVSKFTVALKVTAQPDTDATVA